MSATDRVMVQVRSMLRDLSAACAEVRASRDLRLFLGVVQEAADALAGRARNSAAGGFKLASLERLALLGTRAPGKPVLRVLLEDIRDYIQRPMGGFLVDEMPGLRAGAAVEVAPLCISPHPYT